MKLMKEELIWIIVVVVCYASFLIPGIPEYGNVRQTLLHGGITLTALYIANYAGQIWINTKLEIIKKK